MAVEVTFTSDELASVLRLSHSTTANAQPTFEFEDVPSELREELEQEYLDLLLDRAADFSPFGKRLRLFARKWNTTINAALAPPVVPPADGEGEGGGESEGGGEEENT